MSHLIVGDNGCSYNDILKQISTCETFTNVRNDWRQIATFLDLSLKQQDDIEGGNPSAAPLIFMQQILVLWRSKASQGATLGVLVNTLELLSYNDMANKLKTFFNVIVNTPAASNNGASEPGTHGASNLGATTEAPKSVYTDAEILRKHIITNQTSLIADLFFNSTFASTMLAEDILSEEDIGAVEAITVRQNQNKKFFEFIRSKLPGDPEIYAKLIKALDDTRQIGVSKILKEVL